MNDRILGIDPGFGRIGYGIIEETKNRRWRAVSYGCIATDPQKNFVERLKCLHEKVTDLIEEYRPTRLAVEKIFYFKNAKTVIEVAQARGVIILTGVGARLPVDEFTPLQVKQAIANYGRAEKTQIQKMVGIVLGIKAKITPDDAADALAVALCAGQSLWLKKLS